MLGTSHSSAHVPVQDLHSDDIVAQLTPRVSEALGEPATLHVHQAGGSRAAFRVATAGDDRAGFLRLDDGNSGMSGTMFDLGREAEIMRRVRELGIPAPRIIAVFDAPSATLLEYVNGSSHIDLATADQVGPEFMGWVVAIHQLDPAAVFDGTLTTTTDAVRADLEWWVERSHDVGLQDEPVDRLAARILRETAPIVEDTPRLVHGDIGAGNFIVDDGRVASMLDWEMAHVGDPHEDLAWLWMRGAHSEFGDPQTRFAEYQRAGGADVDPVRLQWHLAFVLFKTQVALRGRLQRPGGGRLVLTQHVFLLLYEALLASALARLVGEHVDPLGESPVGALTPEVRLAERALEIADGSDRELGLILANIRGVAETNRWRHGGFATDLHRTGIAPDTLLATIDCADQAGLASIAAVVARDAGRACQSSSGAIKRLKRAAAIGL